MNQGVALQDLAGRRFTSTSFAIGGDIAMHVPGVGNLDIAHGGAVYSYPDYIGLAAQVDTQLGIFVFHGGLSGQFNLGRRLFELDANAHICVRGFDIACGGGLLVVSEKGAVACVQLGPLNPGVGVKFNGSVRPVAPRWLQAQPILERRPRVLRGRPRWHRRGGDDDHGRAR
jgi:hypothetical protein